MTDLFSDTFSDTFGGGSGIGTLPFQVGINDSGGEFGTGSVVAGGTFSNSNVGTIDVDYHYDTQATFTYLASRGLRLVRIPFRWERIQPVLGAALNSGELTRLTNVVNRAGTAGMSVVLDVHNYGGYVLSGGEAKIGSGSVTQAHFTDLWTRLTNAFKSNANVGFYGLMNEPHDLAGTTGTFTAAATYYNFESTSQGWAPEGTTTATRTTTTPITGTGSLLLNKTMAAGYDNIRANDASGQADDISANGGTLQLQVKARSTNAGTGTQVRIEVQNSSFAWQTGPWQAITVGTGGTYGSTVTVQYTPAAGLLANCRAIGVQFEGSGLNGSTDVQIDQVQQGTLAGALSAAEAWEQASQAALTAIRTEEGAGTHKTVLVPGYNWSGAQQWSTSHPDPWITDSAGKYAYEAHLYFDNDNSGTYGSSYATENSNAVGQGYASVSARATAQLAVFTGWLSTYSASGFIGEVGWPDDTNWNAVGTAVYTAMRNAGIPSTYWSTGEWWGTGYALSAYKQVGSAVDTANGQAAVIESFMGTASVRGYYLTVDWANDGNYTGPYDNVTTGGQVAFDPPLVVEWGRQEDLTSPVATATGFTFSLNNQTRKFSPGNVSSPLAGNVRTGRKVRLQYVTGGTTTLFEGIIDHHAIDPDDPARKYTAQCLDMWGRPSDEVLSTALYTAMRTGDAIGVVLDEIGWTGGRDIDPGATIMPYWWAEDETAATAVEKIVDSEGPPAIAYVAGGVFYFRDRHHRITRTTSQTSQVTYTGVITPPGNGPVGAYKIEKSTMQYDHGEENVVNSVTFTIDQRQPVNPGTVWTTEDQIVVPASGSTVLHVQAEDPFHSAVTPVAGTDFTVLSGSTPTVSLSRTSGRAVIVNLAGGGTTAVLDGFQLRATSVPVARTVKVTSSDATSITDNQGERGWNRDVPFANAYDAKAIADKIVATWKDPKPRFVFTVPNFTPSYLTEFLAATISDRITVRDDATGTNTDFVVERLRHTITKFNLHRLTVWCQQADPVNTTTWFRFGVAGAGFGQGAFGQ